MNLIHLERERQCFGCTIQEMQSSIEGSITFEMAGYHMVAMSMMSDAQEAMERKDYEWSRQLINRAKWVLSTYRERN